MKTTAELLLQLFHLAQIIQNQKIADIDFSYMGFMNYYKVTLFESKTTTEMYSTVGPITEKNLTEQIEIFSAIVLNGVAVIPGIEEKQAEVLRKKHAMLKQLQEELKVA